MISCHKTLISNATNYDGEGDENEVKMNSAIWNTKVRFSNQMESWITTRISFQQKIYARLLENPPSEEISGILQLSW